jgi:hypothetical protein
MQQETAVWLNGGLSSLSAVPNCPPYGVSNANPMVAEQSY